ncbi:MAG TPA: hypothetical protein PLH39_00955 [Promineifilum sp.]|nr:hypothetical protein [Promineifilum sp.]
MEVPGVKKMGKSFEDIGSVLDGVSKVMNVLLTTLRATAFVGMFGGWALQSYLEQVKPVVDRLAKQCKEIGKDLVFSAQAYERGDAEGSTRFF